MENIKIDNKLLEDYKLASTYHQAALRTYGKENKYERKFRHKLSKIKCKIRMIAPNFKFEPTTEVIDIDYSLFDLNIEELLVKDFDLLTVEEFNFVSHYCSGGMFAIYGANKIELENFKYLYLFMHESDYETLKRITVINNIIKDGNSIPETSHQ